MGYDYSLSFHEGDNFSLAHDNREKISPNVNPEKIKENIVYEGNISLQKFYEETFQKAYEEYIQKQIKNRHADRVRDWPPTYYEFIRNKQMEQEKIKQKMKIEKKHIKEIHEEDNYQRVAKQIIVQVGNIDDFENLSPAEQQELREKMIEILKEYMETFQKENPNFRIVNAVIHCDEVSLSPHLHLTYVPVAELSRGQAVQNSLNSALKSMGFTTDKKKDTEGVWMTAQMKWQRKERDRMIDIAKKHGLSIGFEAGRKTPTRSLKDYQRDRQKERDEALKSRENEVAEKEQNLAHRETIVEKKEIIIEEKKEALNAHIQKVNAQIVGEHQELDERKQDLDKREKEVIEKEEILRDEAEASVIKLQKAISEATESIKPSAGKRVDEYPSSKLKRGYRLVPEKDLDNLIERSWYRPEAIKQTMQNVIDKFNDLPFVQAARQQIYQLENQVLELKRKIKRLKDKNKEQQILLDKAKEIKLGSMGKTMYDHLVSEVQKDRQKVQEMYEQDNDFDL